MASLHRMHLPPHPTVPLQSPARPPPAWSLSVELWIPITIVAALLQCVRTALQQKLKALLSTNGANFVRYFYGAPVSLAMLAAILLPWARPCRCRASNFWCLIALAGPGADRRHLAADLRLHLAQLHRRHRLFQDRDGADRDLRHPAAGRAVEPLGLDRHRRQPVRRLGAVDPRRRQGPAQHPVRLDAEIGRWSASPPAAASPSPPSASAPPRCRCPRAIS